VRARDVVLDDSSRAAFTLEAAGGLAPVRLRLVGEHHVSNALAVAAVALELGMPLPDVADALGAAVARSRWRMEVSDRHDGLTVVNDAYNANPESVAAALRALVGLARGRQTWAVLGEMRELGSGAAAAHHEVGRLAAELGVDRLVVVGEAAQEVATGAASVRPAARRGVLLVPDVEAAIEVLRGQVRGHDVVLVKASRAAGLEAVADALLAEPAEDPTDLRVTGRHVPPGERT